MEGSLEAPRLRYVDASRASDGSDRYVLRDPMHLARGALVDPVDRVEAERLDVAARVELPTAAARAVEEAARSTRRPVSKSRAAWTALGETTRWTARAVRRLRLQALAARR